MSVQRLSSRKGQTRRGFEGHTRSWIFSFFFFMIKTLYSFEPGSTCSEFFLIYFGFCVENRLEGMVKYTLDHLAPTTFC